VADQGRQAARSANSLTSGGGAVGNGAGGGFFQTTKSRQTTFGRFFARNWALIFLIIMIVVFSFAGPGFSTSPISRI